MIEFEGVCLSFGAVSVFEDLSFHADAGLHTCLSGLSGKGKSSILKMVQGFVVPEKGDILVDGLELNPENVKAIRSKLAFAPQNINLPVKNGKELVELIGEDLSEDLIMRNIGFLGLSSDMFNRSFDEMSGGQKQRVVIAFCLALPRQIVLLDEPTASLDDESIDHLIRLVAGQKGKTIVSASHNQKWINSADEVITL
ncbi:energy-coupling factor ABC transporter ATP-binding protein [Marinilabilia rubra]|uniref:ABC transporter n=1 Tax=Marinilabilia rubra TaxID=2162893 RepID=A0A2U2B4V4_9BACT|nr:energy-coupling factor ABC transporter ATP-binding protein [Marinilabilia rubra]PWD98067.1 ABC transporter [Marinilabilia rubra]